MQLFSIDRTILNVDQITYIHCNGRGECYVHFAGKEFITISEPGLTAAALAVRMSDPDCLVKSVVAGLLEQVVETTLNLEETLHLLREAKEHMAELKDQKLLLQHELQAIRSA